MNSQKMKVVLGITLVVFVGLLAIEGTLLYGSSQKPKAPPFKTTEITGTLTSFGSQEEFTIEKDGQVVYQNKATDLPEIQYRISSPGKLVGAKWRDLNLGDKVALMYTYTPDGQTLQSRVLRIFRE